MRCGGEGLVARRRVATTSQSTDVARSGVRRSRSPWSFYFRRTVDRPQHGLSAAGFLQAARVCRIRLATAVRLAPPQATSRTALSTQTLPSRARVAPLSKSQETFDHVVQSLGSWRYWLVTNRVPLPSTRVLRPATSRHRKEGAQQRQPSLGDRPRSVRIHIVLRAACRARRRSLIPPVHTLHGLAEEEAPVARPSPVRLSIPGGSSRSSANPTCDGGFSRRGL